MATALDNLLIQVGGAKNAGVSGGTGANNLDSLFSQVVGGKYKSPVSPYSTKVSEPVSELTRKPNKVTEFLSKSQKLAQDVSTKAGAVSKQVSDKITPIAQRAIPQLDPSQKMEAPKLDKLSYDVPNKPGKMDIFDFKSVETTGSAQLSPKAKADTQKKVDDFLKTPTGKTIVKAGNVIDHFAASLSGERERIKKDLTQLATRGVVTTVGSPRERADSMVDWKSEKARQLLVLDDPKNISSRLNKAWGLALVGNIEGLTGGVLKADKVEPKTIEGKVVYGVAQIMGTVVALRMIGGAFNSLASGSTKIADFVAKYPKWGKHVVALGKNVAAFDIYGQLDPDIQNRLEKLALDTATGTIFSGLSMIKQGMISIPMNFAIGFGLAKSQGASNEDAFIAGGILATLDAASRGSRKLFEPQFKAKGGRLTMTPDEAVAQVAGSDLKGTPAGDQINQLAMQAKIQGKNLQIEMTAGKVSSIAQDLLRVQTPKGAQFTVTLVDPPAKVTGKTKTSPSAKPKEAPAIEPSSVKPTAESSGFADTVAKGKLKIKPGETIGEFQIRSQQARGQSLLAEYDIAMKANDLQGAQSIARKIVADPAYAAYHQQFAKRTGIDMLMKLQQAQQSGDQAEIVRVTDEIRAMGQPKSVTGEVPSPPPPSAIPGMAAASTVTKPATEVKPETKPEAKPEPAETKPVEKPEDKPKRRTIKTEDLPEGVNAIATTRPDGTASLTVHVDPEQQGKGYGAQAVKQLETKLISEGITEVKINADMHTTDPGVQSSVGFWEKMGYVKAGLPKGYFQPMSKDLSKQMEKVVEQKTVPIEDTSREPKKLYRGSNGEVSEVVKTWDKILVVETNQAELIKQLADQGNKAARELYDSMPNKAKVEYVIADPIIKEAYPNYDAIQYNNNHPKLKAQGTTYFETSSGRSFAGKEETARVYAMGTGRPDKHKSKIEKKDAKPKAEYKKEDFDSELLVTKGYDLPELDAQIRSVEEPTKDYNRWIVEVGLQESLGEQGGDILTLTYDKKPTLKDVKDDIREEYKQKKAEINEEVVPGIVAKSGRDEMIEGAIDKVTAADKLTENTEKMLEYLEKADVKDIEETAENIRVAIDALWVNKIDTQPEWMTEIRNLGSTRFYDMPGGVTAALQILEYDNTIWLKRIEVSDKGKGTGTTIINKIKDYADKSNQKLVILSPKYNPEFWKKFDYLTKNENGNYEYVPEKRPEVLAGIEKDIPYQTAMNAHQGTSFYPEKRGKSEIAGYVEILGSTYKDLQVYATTPEKQATLDRMFGYLREGYKKRYLDLLVAKSRVMSSMITGSARFPVARNQNKLNAADNKSQEVSDFHDKMYKKIMNELNPQTFKGTSEKTIDQMGEKLAKLKANQELMKAANKIIQSDKDVEPRLKELGLSDATIKDILAGDFMGRKGYPSYRLTSINNKIKTLEKRQAVTVAKREKFNTTGNAEVKIGDVTVIKNYDQNRLQLKFPGKPPDEMRANLKSAGFRWSPFNKVWQRVLTNDAIWRTKKLLGVDKLFAETKPAPTEEAPIVPVTDPSEVQRIQNSIDEGEMIIRAGTRNGRKISLEEEEAIQRSIDNAKAKIGKDENNYTAAIERGAVDYYTNDNLKIVTEGRMYYVFENGRAKTSGLVGDVDSYIGLVEKRLGNTGVMASKKPETKEVVVAENTELYHGTSKEKAHGIRSNGLLPSVEDSNNYWHGIYLTMDKEVAADYASYADDGGTVLTFKPKRPLKLLELTKEERENFIDVMGEAQEDMVYEKLMGEDTEYDGFYLPDIGLGDGSPQVVIYDKLGSYDAETATDMISLSETKPEAVEPKPETKPEVKPKPKPATKTAPVRPKQLISLLNKNNVPILENILVKDGVMQLTDLEKFISLKTDVEDGLYRVVGDELVASTDNVDDWPEIPVIEKEYQLSVPAPELATMLTKLVPAVTKDNTRPILQSVVFTVSDSELNLTATDGMMISHQRMPVVTRGFDQDISLDLAIPGSKIDKLVSILGDGEVKISSSTDSDRSQTEFKSDLGTITFRNRQGEYPPYEKIYQTGFKNQLEFDKKSLQSALKEMTPFLKLSKEKTAVEILIEDGKATMNVDYSADGYGVGNLKKTIPLELIKQGQVNIGQGILDGTMVMPFRRFDKATSEGLFIQKPFLNDALKTIEGARVFLSYNELNGLKPVHFSDKLEVPYTIKPKFLAKTKPSEPPKPSQKSYSSKNPMSTASFTEELPRIGTGREDVKIETIKIIEFPEMLKIVRELTGNVPKLQKSSRYLGVFDQMLNQIRLNPKIFESEIQAARVFAHEIGHMTDYLAKSGKTLKRGNLLGRLASLSSYRKHFISDRPPATSDLITPEDRDRLRKEAIRLSKEPVEVEKEVVIDEIAVEPKEILDIWNSTKSSIKNPELLKYIQTLSSAEKVSIVKAALQGVVPEWVKFTKQVKQIITVKEFRKAPDDIKKLYRKLLAEEVEKRHLISLETVREELKQLSYAWRPLNPDGSSRGEMSYRNSGIELYADAISVLFNDPVRLEQDAPIFYRSFFNYLDNKPEAKEAFFDAWHLLNQGEDAVLGQRLESIDKMFKNAEDKAKALKHERDAVRRDVMFELKYQFLNEYQPASDLVKKLKKAGKQIDPDDNPQYALNSYNYLGSKIRSFLDREINPWYSKLAEKGVTWEDVGKLMLLDRIIGERKNIANPLGLSQSTAEPTREKMLRELGEVKTKNLQEAVDLFREAYRKVMDDAYIRGQLYGEDLYKQISENNTYATYRVTDYLDKNVSAKIYKQIGTLKDIGNPATATMAKMIATIRATERAVTNRKMIDLLKKEAPGEIELAKTRWNGRRQEPVKPTDGRGLVINMENGKAVGYYVDPFIADMISYTGLNNTNIAVDLFKKTNSSWFRPIFTGINLGFMVWNVERDFIRPWKAMGNVSLGKYTANYVKALKPVAKRSLGIYDKDINEMERIEALAPTFNELTAGMTEEDTQMSVLWDRYSGHGKDKLTLKKMYLNLFWPLQELANVIEKLPKVATYYSLKDKMPTAELANFIRTKGGSPDFLARGKVTAITNPIFLFSNAQAQSMYADYDTMTNPKTRMGFWFKTFLLNILPKLLMKAAIMGLFGTFIKKLYDNISEYNMTNYNPIPWGIDENEKTVWTPGVSDHTGQLIGGITWKMLNLTNNQTLEEGLKDLFAYVSGNTLPSFSPIVEAGSTTLQYLQGQNPYDSYRNREIMSDTEFAAGGMYSLIPFLKYQFQSLGGSIIFGGSVLEKSKSGNVSELEKVINLPIASNVLQRLIRVSDYGRQEKYRKLADQKTRELARIRLEDNKIIDDAVSSVQNGADKRGTEKELVNTIRGDQKVTPEIESRMNYARSNFRLALIRGQNDPDINALIYAGGNQQKAVILKGLEENMDSDQFDEFLKEALVNKVISAEVLNIYRRM